MCESAYDEESYRYGYIAIVCAGTDKVFFFLREYFINILLVLTFRRPPGIQKNHIHTIMQYNGVFLLK